MNKKLSYIASILVFSVFNGCLISASYNPPAYCPSDYEVSPNLASIVMKNEVNYSFIFNNNQFQIIYKSSAKAKSKASNSSVKQIQPPEGPFSDACFYEMKTGETGADIVTFGIDLLTLS